MTLQAPFDNHTSSILVEHNVTSRFIAGDENVTHDIYSTYNTDCNEYQCYLWIISQAITPLNLIFCIWAFVGLCFYGKNSGRFKIKSKASLIMVTSSTILPVFVFIRVILTQSVTILGVLNIDDKSLGTTLCEKLIDASSLTYAFSVLVMYMFYGSRQHILYSKQTIEHLNTKFIKFCRFLSIIVIFCGLVVTSLYVNEDNYVFSDYGCIKIFKEHRNLAYDYTVIASLILCQTILFFLFVYPLKFLKDTSEVNSEISTVKTRKRLQKALKKVTLGFVLSVGSDLVSLLITLLKIPHTVPREALIAVYDFGLCICLFSVTLASGKLKSIFIFWKADSKQAFTSTAAESKSVKSKVNSATVDTEI